MKYIFLLLSSFAFAEPLTCVSDSTSMSIVRSPADKPRTIYLKGISSPLMADQELTFALNLCNKMTKNLNALIKNGSKAELECGLESIPGKHIKLSVVKFEKGQNFGQLLLSLDDSNSARNDKFGSRVGFHTCDEVLQEYKIYLDENREVKK